MTSSLIRRAARVWPKSVFDSRGGISITRRLNLVDGVFQFQQFAKIGTSCSPLNPLVPASVKMAESADIGLIGLGIMGQNIILNMNDHGFTVCAYNRTTDKVDAFLANEAKGTKIIGARSVEEMIKSLKKPRRVMLLVKAGKPVDDFIDLLLPHLEKGDIVIDGGNSEYQDTNRRVKDLSAKGILFVGSGVSGGEEGARYGPFLMPGGNPEAWPHIKDIFQSIAAKVGREPCCDWVGEDGSGHFVKMVHNGIEYGHMQLICEAYHFMKEGLKLDNDQMNQIFTKCGHTSGETLEASVNNSDESTLSSEESWSQEVSSQESPGEKPAKYIKAKSKPLPLHLAFRKANTIMKNFYEQIKDGSYDQLSDSEVLVLFAEQEALAIAAIGNTTKDYKEAIEHCRSNFKIAHHLQLQVEQRRRHVYIVQERLNRKYQDQIIQHVDASWITCETLDEVFDKVEILEDVPIFDPCDLVLVESIGTDEESFCNDVQRSAATWLLDVIEAFRRIKKDILETLEEKKFIREEDLQLEDKEEDFLRILEVEPRDAPLPPEGLKGLIKTLMQELKEESKKEIASKLFKEQVRYASCSEYSFEKFEELLKTPAQDASKELPGPGQVAFDGDVEEFVEHIRKALYASKIISYAQGFMFLKAEADIHNWKLNFGGIALMWRGGCIIRSAFLGNIKEAFDKNPELNNLLLDPVFKNAITECQTSWRKVVCKAIKLGIQAPCFSTALAFYEGFRLNRLPANWIQAQRDYFGAHTNELEAAPGKFIHTN